MQGRDLVKNFKNGTWGHSAIVEQFLAAITEFDSGDVVKLVDVLVSKANSREMPAAVKNRATVIQHMVAKRPDPALFLPFVKAMKGAPPQVQQVLAELLPRVNHPPHHGELAALMKSSDPQLRRMVAMVLMQVGGKSVFEELREYIRESGFQARIEAIEVLVKIAGHFAIPALADAVRVGSNAEKAHALKHLGNPELSTKDPQAALDAIKGALETQDARVVGQAASAYSAICDEDQWFENIAYLLESTNLNLVKAAVDGLRRFQSPRAVRALETAFRVGPNAIRMTVLDTVEQIANETVLPLLVESLNHRSIQIKNRGAEVLTKLALDRKIEVSRTVIWLLRSRDSNVRRIAIDIANRVGDPNGEMWPKLLRFLRDEDWWVRERVIDALVDMAGTNLTRHIVGYLSDPSDVVRRYAVGVLMRLKDPNSLGALCRTAMEDPDWWVREWAISAMGELKDKRAIPYILNLMVHEPDLRFVCVEAIQTMEAREAAPHVAAMLQAVREDTDLVMVILKCLVVLNDPQQAGHVAPLLQDANLRVRETARELLLKWNLSQSQLGGVAQPTGMSKMDQILLAAIEAEADDLILASGRKPFVKRRGQIVPLADYVLPEAELQQMLFDVMSGVQQDDLRNRRDVDFSYEVKAQELRFRANVFLQNVGLSAVFRAIRDRIPLIEELGLPEVMRTFGRNKNGLILVGGPTGSGKSTTLAAIINDINRNEARHIITLEDPIEVVHRPQKSLITQREIGTHSNAYADALRATLREDPDVILVGELRDHQTIAFAVSAAETGHLVFGTVHTVSVDNSIDRMVNAFPSGQQPQVRSMLSGSLRAVACQHLLRRADGQGRVLAVEVMINNDAIAALIRKGKTFQIPSVVATGRELGMQSMDSELMRLFKAGIIAKEEAYMKASNKGDFEAMFREMEGQATAAAAVAPTELPAEAMQLLEGFDPNAPSATSTPSMPASPAASSPGMSAPPGAVGPGGAPAQPGAPGQPRPARVSVAPQSNKPQSLVERMASLIPGR